MDKIIYYSGVYPAFDDYWFYNVSPADYESILPASQDQIYFYTTSNPPPLGYLEEWPVLFEATVESVHQYLRRNSFAEQDSFGRPIWGPREEDYYRVIRDYSEDRTFGFIGPFDEPSILSRDLIESLQREVIQPNPLWRFWVFDWEKPLLIYPDAVRAAKLPATLPQREAIEGWLPGHMEREESRLGPRRRQFQWVRNLIPDALEQLSEKRVVVLAVFDHFESEPDSYSLWAIHQPPSFSLAFGPTGEPEIADERYPVGRHGEIGPEQWLAEEGQIPVWLSNWSYSKGDSLQTEFEWRQRDEVVRVPYDLSLFEIINRQKLEDRS